MFWRSCEIAPWEYGLRSCTPGDQCACFTWPFSDPELQPMQSLSGPERFQSSAVRVRREGHSTAPNSFKMVRRVLYRPNAVQRSRKGVLSIAATRTIAEGEEVCITYSDLTEPSFDRRRHLLHHFHFDSRPDVRLLHSLPMQQRQLEPCMPCRSILHGGRQCCTCCSACALLLHVVTRTACVFVPQHVAQHVAPRLCLLY